MASRAQAPGPGLAHPFFFFECSQLITCLVASVLACVLFICVLHRPLAESHFYLALPGEQQTLLGLRRLALYTSLAALLVAQAGFRFMLL